MKKWFFSISENSIAFKNHFCAVCLPFWVAGWSSSILSSTIIPNHCIRIFFHIGFSITSSLNSKILSEFHSGMYSYLVFCLSLSWVHGGIYRHISPWHRMQWTSFDHPSNSLPPSLDDATYSKCVHLRFTLNCHTNMLNMMLRPRA